MKVFQVFLYFIYEIILLKKSLVSRMPIDIVRESEKEAYRGFLNDEIPIENHRTPLNLFDQFTNRAPGPINRSHYDVHGAEFSIDLKTHRTSIFNFLGVYFLQIFSFKFQNFDLESLRLYRSSLI